MGSKQTVTREVTVSISGTVTLEVGPDETFDEVLGSLDSVATEILRGTYHTENLYIGTPS